MRTLIVILSIAFGAVAADLYMFSPDGTNIVSGARELPSVAVRLDTGEAVLGLYAASDADKAACGWHRCVASTNAAPEGCVVASRSYAILGAVAVETLTFKPRPSANVEISKFRLLENLAALGAEDAFCDYIASDVRLQRRWDAATTLDSTNAMVVAAMAGLSAELGIDAAAITNLIWRSRARQ